MLTKQGIPTPSGKKNWSPSTVDSILQNEKYKGNAILQKTFCVDFLTKKMKVNEGELPQYYVENSHPAIIDSEVFDEVQHELAKRKKAGYTSRSSCFSSRIVCGECGGFYGPKVWHSTSKYKRTIWQCNRKFKDGKRCSTPHLYEDYIKDMFIRVMNSMVEDKESILAGYKEIVGNLGDTTELDQEERKLASEGEVVLGLIEKLVNENARKDLDQDDYSPRYAELVKQYESIQVKLAGVAEHKRDVLARGRGVKDIIKLIGSSNLISEFDGALWKTLVDRLEIYSDGNFFIMKDGRKVRIFRNP